MVAGSFAQLVWICLQRGAQCCTKKPSCNLLCWCVDRASLTNVRLRPLLHVSNLSLQLLCRNLNVPPVRLNTFKSSLAVLVFTNDLLMSCSDWKPRRASSVFCVCRWSYCICICRNFLFQVCCLQFTESCAKFSAVKKDVLFRTCCACDSSR